MADLLTRLDRVTSIDSMLGIEGQAASLFFGRLGRMLKDQGPGRPFDFRSRKRPPPRDAVT